ncbi:MAG: heavy metal translocating P-type ATPase metal-binding domain-containing protein [Balneolaceae bacterium]
MGSTSSIVHAQCFHCGEDCEENEIRFEEKSFCCEGCCTVFQILNENDLCTYYQLDERAGNTVKTNLERQRFDYLLDLEVQHKLVDFKKDNTVSVTFFVPNIHCTSCVWLLENLQNIDSGVLKGTVNFLKRTVTILFDDSETSLRSLVELLTTIGYEPSLKLEQLGTKKAHTIERNLWLKLGVAGFCFGNIMLFSFPEYLNMDQSDSSVVFKYVFGGLNIILAIPVLFYSGIDYLKSAWAALNQKGINLDVPISIGMLALFGRSLYEILSGTGAGYFDSFTGFIFFLLIGKMVQKKTFDRLSFDRDYKSYLPISVIKIDSEEEISVPVNRIEIGDHILIRNKELIPADSINTSPSLSVDYSFITGESEPVILAKGELVFAGGKVIGQSGELIVSKKVEHSYLTQLWENESFKSSDNKKNLTSFADRISPYFTVSVIKIALLSLLVWFQIDSNQAFTIFTAVLIVACPCALALSTPFTLGSTVNILAANGFYLKNLSVVEALSKANTIVFDKTGTITESKTSTVEFLGKQLSKAEKELIASVFKTSIHPLSNAISHSFPSTRITTPSYFQEILGKGVLASFDEISISIGNQEFIKQKFPKLEQHIPLAPQSGSTVHVVIGSKYRGYFIVQNRIRDGFKSLIHHFKNSEFSLYILSGDNENEKSSLLNLFPYWKELKFNQTPTQKLDFVQSLTERDDNIVMIGDGLNDAGALKASNFGIAISDDISSFSPACDAIIDSNSLEFLHHFIRFSKSSFNIIIASFTISLVYNLTGLGFALTGNLSPLVAAILMPLSSITIMGFTTLATRIKAQRMGLKLWA